MITKTQIKRLKDQASQYFAKGKWDKALATYREISKLVPQDLRFQMKIGEILQKTNQVKEAIEVYKRVAEAYAKAGFLVQGIAVCKIILELDPKEDQTKHRLSDLYAMRGLGVVTPATPSSAPAIAIKKNPVMAAPTPVAKMPIPHELDVIDLTEVPLIEMQQLPEIPLFSHLGKEEFEILIDQLTLRRMPEGTMVCKEGELSNSMYIIAYGHVEVFVQDQNGKEKLLAVLNAGDFFGEISMFTHSARTASCRTKDETDLLEIKRSDFQTMTQKYPRVKEVLKEFYRNRILDTILVKSEVFSPLDSKVRKQLIDKFVPQDFQKGEIILREGDFGDSLFVIQEGGVEISTEQNGKKIHLAYMKSGDLFGEVALLQSTKRTATVEALERCELLRLDREIFLWVKGQQPEIENRLQRVLEERVQKTIRAVSPRKYNALK